MCSYWYGGLFCEATFTEHFWKESPFVHEDYTRYACIWVVLAICSIFTRVFTWHAKTPAAGPSSESTTLVGEGRKGPEYLSDIPPTLLQLERSFCSHSRDEVSSCSWKRLWSTSRFPQSKTVGLKLVLQLKFSTEDSTWIAQKNSGSSLHKVGCGLLS